MFTRIKSFKNACLAIAALSFGVAGTAQASLVYVEGSDAGQTLATATSIPGTGSINAIQGTLNGDADLFAIYLTAGTAFSATTTASSIDFNFFDTVLYLFDATGHGLIANDDDGIVGGSQSTLSNYLPSFSGLYYLAITGAGYTPMSGGSQIFPSLFGEGGNVDANSGVGALTDWSSVTSEFGDYEIQLVGASAIAASDVPEPGMLPLVGAALGAAGLIRRRKSIISARA